MASKVFSVVVVVVFGWTCVRRIHGGDVNGNLASQVSQATGSPDRVRGDPDFVVDGVRSTTNADRCFQVSDNSPELHVLLTEDTFAVNFVLIYVNLTNYDYFAEVQVFVGDAPCVEFNITNMAGVLTAVCTEPVTGSRVRIRLPGDNRSLRICEVEVYDTTCDCLDGCHDDQTECFAPCPRTSTCRRENVALAKHAHSSPLANYSGPPSIVVNGNTGTTSNVRTDVKNQNCIKTQNSTSPAELSPADLNAGRRRRATSSLQYVTPSWSVDLGGEVPVRGVVIYRSNAEEVFRTGTVTQITVDGEKCATYGPENISAEEGLSARLVVKCDQVVRGRKVKVTRIAVSDTIEPAPLQLCEVQIWSCKSGWYGQLCDKRCGRCEEGRVNCDPITGDCPGDCQTGWWRTGCDIRCQSGCLDNQCQMATGHCLQCPANYALPYCTGCVDGWYGDACGDECGHCLNDAVCDKNTGKCPNGCEDGFLPPLCQLLVGATTISTTTTNATATNEENNDDDDSGNVGVVAGAVVGVLAVVAVVVVVIFLWYRRRRDTEKRPLPRTPPTGAVIYTRNEKPEASKTESYPYTDAMSPNNYGTDVTTAADETVYDVIYERPVGYDSLEELKYANMNRADDHNYITPVFKQALEGQTSNASNSSGGYMNMGAT